tara:strand:+ start:3780 stop:4850 length:1071 start_codon:yes stop_codon:yes gene_type:complete
MSRAVFERRRVPRWAAFEHALGRLSGRAKRPKSKTRARDAVRSMDEHAAGDVAKSPPRIDDQDIPSAYRRICQDLALARHRMYPARTVERLNHMALEGHHALYSGRQGAMKRIVAFVLSEFPREVRQNAGLFWFCAGLFFVPFLTMMFAGIYAPEWIFATLSPDMMATLDDTWGSDRPAQRTASENIEMFGHYVQNNIGIDFQVFGGGILFCLGTLFYTVYNGIYLGAVFGYIHHAGHEHNFYTFVAGHGSFELTAIVIAAMGGMKVGLALLKPGRHTRMHALKVRGHEGVRLLFGAAFMTLVAAFIEGFWSASPIDSSIKFQVGTGLWIVVALWLLLGGRDLRRLDFRRGGRRER